MPLENAPPASDLLRQTTSSQSTVVVSQGAAASVIRGTVTGSSGAVASGSGFSAVRSSAGVYVVTFDAALASVPVVSLDIIAGLVSVIRVDPAASTTGFGVKSFNLAGSATDGDFGFVAYPV